MMTKERIPLFIAINWALRLRLTKPYPNFAKLECLSTCDDSIYKAISLFYKTILHNNVGFYQKQTTSGICQTCSKSTSLFLRPAQDAISNLSRFADLFSVVLAQRKKELLAASMRAGFHGHTHSKYARTHAQTSARLARTRAHTPASCARERTSMRFFGRMHACPLRQGYCVGGVNTGSLHIIG